MLSQEKFNKLSKYALRLEKSFIKNNSTDYLKYCSHLKYHIGGDNTQIDKLFDGLINLINNNPDYKLGTLKKEKDDLVATNTTLVDEKKVLISSNNNLTKENDDLKKEKNDLILSNTALTKEKNDLNVKIDELKKTNDGLKAEKEKLDDSIGRYKDIIKTIHDKLDILKDKTGDEEKYKSELVEALNEFKNRLNEKETMCKSNDEKIDENNKKIAELDAAILELKAKIQEQETMIEKLNNKIKQQETMITTLTIERDKANIEKNNALDKVEQSKTENIKALEELGQKNYSEFKSKLTQLFKAIYPETIADAIIAQMNVGERIEPLKTTEPVKITEPDKTTEIEKRRNEVQSDLEKLNYKKVQARRNKSLNIDEVNKQIQALNYYIENGGTKPRVMKGGSDN